MKAADVDGRLKKGALWLPFRHHRLTDCSIGLAGTYFSMPEWFNPDYAKYGWGNWVN
jgi:hypothetical protein